MIRNKDGKAASAEAKGCEDEGKHAASRCGEQRGHTGSGSYDCRARLCRIHRSG